MQEADEKGHFEFTGVAYGVTDPETNMLFFNKEFEEKIGAVEI